MEYFIMLIIFGIGYILFAKLTNIFFEFFLKERQLYDLENYKTIDFISELINANQNLEDLVNANRHTGFGTSFYKVFSRHSEKIYSKKFCILFIPIINIGYIIEKEGYIISTLTIQKYEEIKKKYIH